MSVWASALISALSGIGGVATGSVVQARFGSAQETRRLRYEPAADMAKRLRGAATSVGNLLRFEDDGNESLLVHPVCGRTTP